MPKYIHNNHLFNKARLQKIAKYQLVPKIEGVAAVNLVSTHDWLHSFFLTLGGSQTNSTFVIDGGPIFWVVGRHPRIVSIGLRAAGPKCAS